MQQFGVFIAKYLHLLTLGRFQTFTVKYLLWLMVSFVAQEYSFEVQKKTAEISIVMKRSGNDGCLCLCSTYSLLFMLAPPSQILTCYIWMKHH